MTPAVWGQLSLILNKDDDDDDDDPCSPSKEGFLPEGGGGVHKQWKSR